MTSDERTKESGVRPVPILDESTVEAPDVPKPPKDGSKFRWAALGGVMLLIAAVFAISTLVDRPKPVAEELEEPLETDVPAAAVRDHLDASDTLVLVASQTAGEWTIEWDPIMNPPPDTAGTIGLIPYNSSPVYGPQRIDASGTFAVGDACDRTGCSVRISALVDRIGTVAQMEGSAATWHATDPGAFAWLVDGDDPVIRTAVLEGDARIYEPQTMFEPEDDERVVRYDAAGFITTSPLVRIRDADGVEAWTTANTLVDATSALVVATSEDSWTVFDRVTGSVIARLDSGGRILIGTRIAETATVGGELGVERLTLAIAANPSLEDLGLTDAGIADEDGVLRIYRTPTGGRLTLEYVVDNGEGDVG